jgi:hypothetical protein
MFLLLDELDHEALRQAIRRAQRHRHADARFEPREPLGNPVVQQPVELRKHGIDEDPRDRHLRHF